MPYIPSDTRKALLQVKIMPNRTPGNAGELCFVITHLCKQYLEGGVENFDRYGDVRQALASAWDAYFLERLQQYEAKKCAENGDLD